MAEREYPSMLAHGFDTTYAIDPAFELFAGESKIVTDQINTAGTALAQFEIYALDETGKAVPWNPGTGAAVGTLTFSGPGTAADTVTINGHVITLVAAGAAGAQVNIGASATLTAQALKTYINAHPDETGVTASGAAAVLTLTAIEPGVAGNSITTTEAGTNTSFGAATLVNGSEESENVPVGFAAQPIAANSSGPSFVGGIFNHEALKWPASVTTLAARKAAWAGTPIGVRQLL